MNKKICSALFLFVEAILYILLLSIGGTVRVVASYGAIVLCFIYALLNVSKKNAVVVSGHACTLVADFFLVVLAPAQRLSGMIFFLFAQLLYARKLHLDSQNKVILIVRFIMSLVAVVSAFIILKDKSDALSVVSVVYYVNLLVNIIEASICFKKDQLFAIGLVFFLLCDTVVGLQAAAGVYLPISEESLIYKIIFMDFFLSWFFYLPSQVLIAMSTNQKAPD